MALITTAQFTIVDLNDPIQSGSQPTSPIEGMLWLDTSLTPNQLKRYNGAGWVIVNDTSGIQDTITSLETRIDQDETAIALRATKQELSAAKGELQTSIGLVEVTANKINWLVESGTSASNMTLTDEMLSATARDIDLSANHTMTFNADQLNQIATDINLSGNNTIRLNSTLLQQIADQIEIEADQINVTGQDIDLSAANSITLSAGQQKSLGSSINISENGSITLIAAAVDAAQSAADAAQSDIDNLKIGGRNYLRSSRALHNAELIADGVYQIEYHLHIVSGVTAEQTDNTLQVE